MFPGFEQPFLNDEVLYLPLYILFFFLWKEGALVCHLSADENKNKCKLKSIFYFEKLGIDAKEENDEMARTKKKKNKHSPKKYKHHTN